MARFMDVHSGFFGVTEEQLLEAHRRDQAIEGEEGVHFEKAWLDPEAGKVFCLATGPSKESVLRIQARRAPDQRDLRGPGRGRVTGGR